LRRRNGEKPWCAFSVNSRIEGDPKPCSPAMRGVTIPLPMRATQPKPAGNAMIQPRCAMEAD
jgi:hypothetical protein